MSGAAMRYTAFDGHRRLAAGTLADAALAVRRAADAGAAGPLLVFADETGRVVDVDTRGGEAEIVARVAAAGSDDAPEGDASDASDDRSAEGSDETGGARRRGRPRLGVVAREVTLLPRHWEWLATQPGGASVALRRLVEEARRAGAERDRARRAQEAAYRFTHAVAGDLPGYEEATRALFAGDRARFRAEVAAWPADVAAYAESLAFPGAEGATA